MAVETRAASSDANGRTVVHDQRSRSNGGLTQRKIPSPNRQVNGSVMTPKSSSKSTRGQEGSVEGGAGGGDTGDDSEAQSQRLAGHLNLQVAVGEFLETIEVQLAIVFLIALDVCCTALEIHLHDQRDLMELRALADASETSTASSASAVPIASPSVLLVVATRLVESFTGFTIFFFLIEMLVLIAAFRKQFFTHFGYVLDLGVVLGALAFEICAQSKAIRLLGVLRVWRVFRLVNTLLERERKSHDATKDALDEEQTKALHLDLEKQAAEESLKREYESRGGLEKLLQGYKDEVETLREALNIAAEAVAEASRTAYEEHQEQDEQQLEFASIGETEAPSEVADKTQSQEHYYFGQHPMEGYFYAEQQQHEDDGSQSRGHRDTERYAEKEGERFSHEMVGERGDAETAKPPTDQEKGDESRNVERLAPEDAFEDAMDH